MLGEDGKPTTEIAGVAYITGRITVELDGNAYSHADAGRCIFNGDTPEALDMAIAGEVTDCLKRCFRQLGEQFGNSLYDKEIARTAFLAVTAGLENGASNGHGSNGNGQSEKSTGQTASPNSPATPNQPASQSETLQYRDGIAVDTSNAAEVEAFNAFKSAHQGLAPASREVLRGAELDDLQSLFADEMRVSNSPRGCPTEVSPVLIPVNPKTWLEWALEHPAAKAAAGRRSTGKRSDVVQPGQLSIWSNLKEE